MEDKKKEIRIVLRCCSAIDLKDRTQVGQIYSEIVKRNCLRSELGRRYVSKLRAVLTETDSPTCFMCGELSKNSLCRECYDELVTILRVGSEEAKLEFAAEKTEKEEKLVWTASRPESENEEALVWSDSKGPAARRGNLWDELFR